MNLFSSEKSRHEGAEAAAPATTPYSETEKRFRRNGCSRYPTKLIRKPQRS